MKLPGGGRRKVACLVSESNAYLNEFGVLDVMPDELIVDLFLGDVLKVVFFDKISWEFCVLNRMGKY